MTDFHTAREFAQFIKGLGFRAFVAKNDGPRGYGFITDAEGSRVLGFQFSDGGTLGGNYNGGRDCGSGWRMDEAPWDLKTAEDVRKALYATAPQWTGFHRGGKRCPTCGQSTGSSEPARTYTTLEQHLKTYGSSSKYEEI